MTSMPTGDIEMNDQQAKDELKEIFFHEAAADGLALAQKLTAFLERKDFTAESAVDMAVLCNHFSAALFGLYPGTQKLAVERLATERPDRLDRIAQTLGAAMERKQGLADEH